MEVQAVVKANSKINGNGKNSASSGSKTTDGISLKLGRYNQVSYITAHTNPCCAATTWVVSPTGELSHVLFLADFLFLVDRL